MSDSPAYQELEVLKQIAQATNQVFFIYNLNTKQIDYINEQFEQLWNTKGEGINAHLTNLISSVHPEDREFVELNYEQFLSGPKRKSLEFRLLLPDEWIKWLSLHTYKIFGEGKALFIAGFVEDITPRKEREDNSLKFNTKKNAVLEILTHQIKGALGIIGALNDRIHVQAKLGENQRMLEYTKVIKDLCEHNGNLIRSLLNSEFIESADIKLVRKRFDLVTTIEHLLEEYRHSDKDLKKHFHFLHSAEAVYVEVDEVLFTQVINNLISNAIKFTHEEGNIRVRIEEKPNTVLISVQDDGIGVPKDLQSTIFDRFTKARREGLKGEESVGLGMSIIKRIVELHQGKVWLESEKNQGSSFFVEIERNVVVE